MFCCLMLESSAAPEALADLARACSPRVELAGDRVAIFDARGLGRVLGPPEEIVRAVGRLAADRGVSVRVTIAGTATAAQLLAHAGATELKDVGSLFLRRLFSGKDSRHFDDALDIFHRWGLRTCGDIARLPRAEKTRRRSCRCRTPGGSSSGSIWTGRSRGWSRWRLCWPGSVIRSRRRSSARIAEPSPSRRA
jgi:hypothetical protein